MYSKQFLEEHQMDYGNLTINFLVQQVTQIEQAMPGINYRLIDSSFYRTKYVIGDSPFKLISQIIDANDSEEYL